MRILLRIFVFTIVLSALSVNLVSCELEYDINIGAPPLTNNTDIAITGIVTDIGFTFANINGYTNLQLLTEGNINPEVGIELASEDLEWKDKKGATLVNNIFTVSFRNLSPSTNYKYRSYVVCDNSTYYGEYSCFSTKEFVQTEREAVELGLSVKWASCNVDAEYPIEYGGYYAWGETEEKISYSWSTYKWYNHEHNMLNKYCTNSYYGTVDNNASLISSDDVAQAKWGDGWRLPTLREIKELRDECTWEWTSLNNIAGQFITGPNGNCIFLPAAGYCHNEEYFNRGIYGCYWSNAVHTGNDGNACYLGFYDSHWGWGSGIRYVGRTIRPVTE